jgi:hypothetical protein
MRLTLLGIGAMASPRYQPAGLLVEYRHRRIMLDGGAGAMPQEKLDAWLVTDEQSELIAEIRKLAQARDLQCTAAGDMGHGLMIRPRPVKHTSHPAFGYLITTTGLKVIWAPEFFRFPSWAAGADLMSADGAAWSRPIRFAGGIGGHACVLEVAREAQRRGVRRLVFAHIGRPTLRALDAGKQPPYGEIRREGTIYQPRRVGRKAGPLRSHPRRAGKKERG